MSFRFWFILAITLFFGWGLYTDYSIAIAKFFVGDEAKSIGGAGAWGDTFGAFNGFISLAGAVFIVHTLILQQLTLSEQQKALYLQLADSHRQRFEATYFELLKLLRELRNELHFTHSKSYINAGSTDKVQNNRAKPRTGTDALLGFVFEQRFIVRKSVTKLQDAGRDELSKSYDQAMIA